MDACPHNSFEANAWQATLPSILRDLRDEIELANTKSAMCHQPVRRKLTTEAIFIIFVILLFVILTLIRSLVSVCEIFKANGKETHSSIIERKKKARNLAAHAEEEKKLFETSSYTAFLTNLKKILDCFCIESNAKRIFNTVSTQEELSSLHGIRAIILIWVLIGHMGALYSMAVKTPDKFQLILDLQVTQILTNTIFIVDAFLVLSGFLNGYLFTQHYEKRNGKISWLSFYLHRFVRISPMYFIVLGFYSTLFSYLGSGPVWPTYDTNPVCKENWMWHVLFTHNFISHMKLCLAPTWYLACEMQLYIISPIFLILLMRRPKIGYVLIALGVFGSCLINFVFTKQYKLIEGISRVGDYYSTDLKEFNRRFWEYFDILYTKPYTRLGTYLIGMALGCYLYRRKSSTIKKINLVKLSLGWIMTAIFMWTSMFALYGREESVFESAVYNGLKHLLFSCSVAWIIFVCVTGQGGFVNRFLSSKIFIVISRLSYMTYLTHMIILEGYFLSKKDLIDHSVLSVILHNQLHFWSLAAAFVVSLVFEAPTLRITALFFRENNQEMKARKQK